MAFKKLLKAKRATVQGLIETRDAPVKLQCSSVSSHSLQQLARLCQRLSPEGLIKSQRDLV